MRPLLSGGVGPWQPNRESDVRTVQELLNRHAATSRFLRLRTDGVLGRHTQNAIRAYQRHALKMSFPDGIVSVGGGTFQKLSETAGLPPWGPGSDPRPAPVPEPTPLPATGSSPVVPSNPALAGTGTISKAQYTQAATVLGVEPEVLNALTTVELNGPAFDHLGRPVILFEPVIFSRRTHHVWDKTNPDISRRHHVKADPGHGGHRGAANTEYGPPSQQYPRLFAASHLDQAAALQSASWGKFQLMGFNYKRAGYATVNEFAAAMERSVGEQILAFPASSPVMPSFTGPFKAKTGARSPLTTTGRTGSPGGTIRAWSKPTTG